MRSIGAAVESLFFCQQLPRGLAVALHPFASRLVLEHDALRHGRHHVVELACLPSREDVQRGLRILRCHSHPPFLVGPDSQGPSCEVPGYGVEKWTTAWVLLAP